MAEQPVVTAPPHPYVVRVHRRSAHERPPQHPQPYPQPFPEPQATDSTPPFNAPAARKLRIALGMGPEHVAYGMRSSFGLPYVTPDLVAAWERGTVAPTGPELTALAGVLWCSKGELISSPRTLREHRTARGIAAEDVARTVGLELSAYLRTEETGEWRGTERQSAALAVVLDLTLPELVVVTGREPRLRELLHSAVTTRWQGQVRPTARLLSLDRRLLEDVLREMHTDYQGLTTATLSWANGTAATDSGDAGRDYLDGVVDHFWSLVQRTTAH
ncbi:helix-turn-helix transcriptional regulator [Streptomyces phaeolivaceus]|uniref:Helix-turn-helix transcriptional regulator n=1 Tax=Streptomyces phaeolivaceus TaxID=2653200 RepID=A0A5P8KB87_9ACTN|nr:helix-turn-helix transcriptional regulator [Streptomyces phaeolivaceus]QFR00382.1 helix-turn-helix transcriptional regulator [Streptomyces phaeolivaceus]